MSETERRLAMEAEVVMCYGMGEGTTSYLWADQPLKHSDNGNLRVAGLYKLSFFAFSFLDSCLLLHAGSMFLDNILK